MTSSNSSEEEEMDEMYFFKERAKIIMSMELELKKDVIAYDKFCALIKQGDRYDVDVLAQRDGYTNGIDFLRSIGYRFLPNGDMKVLESKDIKPYPRREVLTPKIIIYPDGTRAPYYDYTGNDYDDLGRDAYVTVGLAPGEVYQWEPRYQPPPPEDVGPPIQQPSEHVHIFDGDTSTLHPGMYVQIATGFVHYLPALPQFDEDTPANREMFYKACEKYNKKLQKILDIDSAMRQTNETYRRNLERSVSS